MAIETGFRCVPTILGSERAEGGGGHLLTRGACGQFGGKFIQGRVHIRVGMLIQGNAVMVMRM